MATLALPEAPLDTGANDGEIGEVQRDYEAEALKHGWRPIEEFKGDPKLFVDAETYAKRAEEVLPFVKKENKQLRGEIDFLKRQIKKVMKSEQAAYQNALTELETRQENAVVTGDVAEHKRLKGEIEALRQNMADDTPGSDMDPAEPMENWRTDNAWYDKAALASAREDEVEARLYADRRLRQMAKSAQNLTGADLYKQAEADFATLEAEIAEKFPTLKTKTPRQKPASDVAGVTPGGMRSKARTGANLPAEAKEQARRFHSQGVYKGTLAEAYDKYAQSYDWN